MKNTKIAYYLLVVTLAALPALGCIERHWASPSIQGKVLEITTHQPLEYVDIFRVPIDGAQILVGRTDINGDFTIEASRKTSIHPPTADLNAFGNFIFIKAGYLPSEYRYRIWRPEFNDAKTPSEKGIVIMLKKK
jgi:hypothetical protein